MAEAFGIDGIHAVKGLCDLCGDVCDTSSQELNALSCSFKDCPPLVYHQDCVEKYLKSIKLERNRKTGFKCPRGCGKGSQHGTVCPGRIDKSHPIHPRNEESKKRRKAKLPDVLPVAKPAPVAKKETKLPQPKAATECKPKPVAAKPPLPGPTPVVKVGQYKAKTDNDNKIDTVKLAEAKALLRQQMGLAPVHDSKTSSSNASSSAYQAQRLQAPVSNAWSKPSPPPQPQPPAPPAVKVLPKPQLTLANGHSHLAPSLSLSPSPTPSMRLPTPVSSFLGTAARSTLSTAPSATSSDGYVPIGMEYAQNGDVADPAAAPVALTKAQKKNLKRAQKKKVANASEAMSVASLASAASSDQDAVAVVEQAAEMELLFEMFIQALVARKVLQHIQQLTKLGFPEWQCGAAVQRFGSDLEAAVTWLLESDLSALTPEDALQPPSQHLPEVDISDDLHLLSEIQGVACLTDKQMQQAVVDSAGEIPACVELLAERGDIPDHCLPEVLSTLGLSDSPPPSATARTSSLLSPNPSSHHPTSHTHPSSVYSYDADSEASNPRHSPWLAPTPTSNPYSHHTTPSHATPAASDNLFSWLGSSSPAHTHAPHKPSPTPSAATPNDAPAPSWGAVSATQSNLSRLSLSDGEPLSTWPLGASSSAAPTPYRSSPPPPAPPTSSPSLFNNTVTSIDRYNQLLGLGNTTSLAPAQPAVQPGAGQYNPTTGQYNSTTGQYSGTGQYNMWSSQAPATAAAASSASSTHMPSFQDFLRNPAGGNRPQPAYLSGGWGGSSLFATTPIATDVPEAALYNAVAVAGDGQQGGGHEDNDVESLMSLVLCRS